MKGGDEEKYNHDDKKVKYIKFLIINTWLYHEYIDKEKLRDIVTTFTLELESLLDYNITID